MTNEPKREITVFASILCLLVICVHVTSEAVSGYDRTSPLYAVVFAANKLGTFATPGFVFLSAFKYFIGFKDGKAFRYGPFIAKRLARIYLPYVLWTLCYFVYFVVIRNYFPFDIGDLLRYIIVGDLSAQFYFIVVIMQFYLLMPLWRALTRPKHPIIFIIFLAAIPAVFINTYSSGIIGNLTGNPDFTLPYTDRWFVTYLPYWFAGMFCGMAYKEFSAKLKERRALIFMLFLLIGGGHIVLCYLHVRGFFFYRFSEEGQTLFIFASILALLALSGIITEKAGKLYPAFKRFEAASFYIFLSHCLVIIHTDYILTTNSVTSMTLRLVIKTLAAVIIPTSVSLAYLKIKSLKIRPCP